jgi:hypothetical protein
MPSHQFVVTAALKQSMSEALLTYVIWVIHEYDEHFFEMCDLLIEPLFLGRFQVDVA